MLGLTMSLGLTAVTRNVRHFQPTGVPVTDPSPPYLRPLAGTTHAEPLWTLESNARRKLCQSQAMSEECSQRPAQYLLGMV